MKNALIVFGRWPVEGKVKTRLAKTVGFTIATDLYHVCLAHTLQEGRLLGDSVSLFYAVSDEPDISLIQDIVGPSFTVFSQEGDDLMDRNRNAVNKAFHQGCQRVIIIASDIPGISKELLLNAFNELEKNDIVLGSDNDGGYYLVGMSKYYEGLFSIEYGGGKGTFEQCNDFCIQKKLSSFILPELVDIDVINDITLWSMREHPSDDHMVKKALLRLNLLAP